MDTALGTAMRREMDDQPEILDRLAKRHLSDVDALIELGVPRRSGLAILARGSSDNAARVAAYSAQERAGVPVHLVSPSVFTAFDGSTDPLADWVVLAVSQSGRTPEIVDLAHRFATSGALVVAVTNDERSRLANTAHLHLALDAGLEEAVPATKTVTAQMLVCLGVASAFGGRPMASQALASLSEDVQYVLDDEEGVAAIADSIVTARGVAMTGRAYLAAAAFESALKLQETTGIPAHAFSTADFRHGPIRVAADLPVLGFAGTTVADRDTRALHAELQAQDRQSLLIGADDRATLSIRRTEPEFEALLATIRGQQIALCASTSLGLNPDHPEGLSKVTLTA